MKLAMVFAATRILDIGNPPEGQSKEHFIQSHKEGVMDDPFSFIDVDPDQIELAVSVMEVKE